MLNHLRAAKNQRKSNILQVLSDLLQKRDHQLKGIQNHISQERDQAIIIISHLEEAKEDTILKVLFLKRNQGTIVDQCQMR